MKLKLTLAIGLAHVANAAYRAALVLDDAADKLVENKAVEAYDAVNGRLSAAFDAAKRLEQQAASVRVAAQSKSVAEQQSVNVTLANAGREYLIR